MAYSDEQKTTIINTICKRVAEGEPLRDICNEDDMVEANTFYSWIDANEAKLTQYARATDQRAHLMAEDILNIADEPCVMTITDEDGKVSTRTDGAKVQQNRLRVDTRKWLASKMYPKKYGDKVQQDITLHSEQPIFPPLKD